MILLVVVHVVYGGWNEVARHAVRPEIAPAFLLWREVGSAIILAPPFLLRRRVDDRLLPRRRDWARVAIAGTLLCSGAHVAFMVGLMLTNPTTAAIMQPLQPLAALAMELCGCGEDDGGGDAGARRRRRDLVGPVAAVGGALAIVVASRVGADAATPAIAPAKSSLAFAAGVACLACEAIFIVIGLRIQRRLIRDSGYSPLAITAWGHAAGAALLLAAVVGLAPFLAPALSDSGGRLFMLERAAWPAMGYAIVFVSAFNAFLLAHAAGALKVETVALFNVVQPMATVALAAVVDGAPVTILHAAGGVGVVWGLRRHLSTGGGGDRKRKGSDVHQV